MYMSMILADNDRYLWTFGEHQWGEGSDGGQLL